MKRYRVYFEQENAEYYEVEAEDREHASQVARKEYMENISPLVTSIEEIK
jgi:hypothetical protein